MPLIVLEGPNGVGKTTMVEMFKQRFPVIALKHPGATPLSTALRDMCRGAGKWEKLDEDVVLHLFLASEMVDWHEKIKPHLFKGNTVVLDRWWPSTLVHQIMLPNILNNIDTSRRAKILESAIYPDKASEFLEDTTYVIYGASSEVRHQRAFAERESNANHTRCRYLRDDKVEAISEAYAQMTSTSFFENTNNVRIDTTNLTAEEQFAATLKAVNIVE